MTPAESKTATLKEWLLSETPTSPRQARLGRFYVGWLELSGNGLAMVGLGIIVILLLMALFAPLLATHSPVAQILTDRLQPPSAEHWLGTDALGRDIYSRIVYGSRLTLYIIGIVAIVVGPVGLMVGTVAGYMGGWVDRVLMRITDIFLAFPRLILALAFVSALGPGIENAVMAIAITVWPPYARMARAETLTIRNADYIAAVRVQGASTTRIIGNHIVPMCMSVPDRPPHPRHGRHHPDRCRPRFFGTWRAASPAGVGGDDLHRTAISPGTMVGRHHAGPRDLHRLPRLQSPRRRSTRRARPKKHPAMTGAVVPPLLQVENLSVRFRTRSRLIEAVRGVSFSMGKEKLGIVGESGSGKSQTGRAILGLTSGQVEAGKATL